METVRLLEMVTDEGKAEKFLGEKGILKTFTEFPSSFLSLKFCSQSRKGRWALL